MKSKVLVTGPTGMLGSQIVAHYLLNTTHDLILLMRSSKTAPATERLNQLLEFWQVPQSHTSRVHIQDVDIQQSRLGLSDQFLREMGDQIEYVIHALSPVRHDMSHEQALHDIVGTTKKAVELAKALPNLKRFSFVSTIEVFGATKGILKEQFLTHTPHFFNTYEYGKFHAERELQSELSRGLPLTIFRPSMIVGHSQTGATVKFQSFYLAIEKFIIKPDFQIMPPPPAFITVPADWAAKAIQLISEDTSTVGQIFHLSQGLDDITRIDQVRKIVESCLRENQIEVASAPLHAPQFLFKLAVEAMIKITSGKTQKGYQNRKNFLCFCGFEPPVDNSKLKAGLLKHGLTWPHFENYAKPVINYYLQHRKTKRFPF
jgi:thioester reductase-like protein